MKTRKASRVSLEAFLVSFINPLKRRQYGFGNGSGRICSTKVWRAGFACL
jgi:hypothetical protein